MPIYKFTPDLMSEEELKEISVGREVLQRRIIDELNQAVKGKYRNHYLIRGPRGIGKTHFLLLLYYAIKEELSSDYIPVKFAEEEYSITSIYHLMIRTLERLSQEGLDHSNTIQIIRDKGPRDGLEYAIGMLRKIRKDTGKQIILLLENLHILFKALGRPDIARLRSLLQEDDTFTFIGTAPVFLNEVASAKEPMYLFFKQEALSGLSDSESMELLEKLDRISGLGLINKERDSDRIKGLNRLTGGYPRLIIWLYEIFSTNQVLDIEKNIIQLLDELTPYYALRMEDIPAQQRVIFDALTRHDKPTTPTELSKMTEMSVQSISSQLKRLMISGYIKKVYPEKRRKVSHYEINDRIFRLWHVIRESLNREKAMLIIRFFKLWYNAKESTDEVGALDMGAFLKFLKKLESQKNERHVFDYLKTIAPTGEFNLMEESLKAIINQLGESYADLLKPYTKALEYAITGDPDVLITLHQEQREVAREIAEMMMSKSDDEDHK